ncbi:MAG TPA: hypothetical protein PLT68_02080 [Actinomycetota bacterium]|nr:hypothetical protein [Actinomycetota bacterium]
MAWFAADDYEGRIRHALKVERTLVNLGYLVAVIGMLAIVLEVGSAVVGQASWSRVLVTSFGILAATVLSGAAAYASGTNVGLAAVRLRRDLEKG